jgi:hypothetical protein
MPNIHETTLPTPQRPEIALRPYAGCLRKEPAGKRELIEMQKSGRDTKSTPLGKCQVDIRSSKKSMHDGEKMLKFELLDEKVRYIPVEKVLVINEHPEGGLAVSFVNPKNETAGFRCTRFQYVKQGTWLS